MRKTVQPGKGCDLLFTLICPKPSELQASWRIHDAMRVYLYPMLAKLERFSRFHVESQVGVLFLSTQQIKATSESLTCDDDLVVMS